MKLRISHGASPDDWFVVRPLEGQATISLAGTPLTHEMAVGSLLDAGRTVFELDTGGSGNIMNEPSPDRALTRTERIEARHLLQELSEHALSVRNAMDPVSGMHTVRRGAWREQYDSLTAQLRYFTKRLS